MGYMQRIARASVNYADHLTTGDLMGAFKTLNELSLDQKNMFSVLALERLREQYIPANPREIFANTEVHLDKVKVFGFDYDFTLASYKTEVQRFIFNGARDHLIGKYMYPNDLRHIVYDKSFAIRGLTFDTMHGLMFKMGPNFRVDLSCVHRGRQRLDEDEAIRALGGNSHLSRGLNSRSLQGIFDQFSLAEACLISDVCEYFYRNNIAFNPAAVHNDVQSSISYVHTSGMMHNAVIGNLERYLHKSPKIRTLLEEMRESASLFLLSNSSFDYINAGMEYICGSDWLSLFDVVLTEARKPDFYSTRTPFRQLDLAQMNQGHAFKKAVKWCDVKSLNPGSVYVGGNAADLMQMTGWNGPEVLYIGDHLFADLRTPARLHGWWTGAIIRELEHEIVKESQPEFQLLSVKMQILEELMRRTQWAPTEVEAQVGKDVLPHLDSMELARKQVIKDMNSLMNSNFGSVFISDAHSQSLFASSMSKYVDVYTSRLENILDYGIDYRFYPRKGQRLLPHEPPGRLELATDLIRMVLKRPVGRRDIRLRSELSFRSE